MTFPFLTSVSRLCGPAGRGANLIKSNTLQDPEFDRLYTAVRGAAGINEIFPLADFSFLLPCLSFVLFASGNTYIYRTRGNKKGKEEEKSGRDVELAGGLGVEFNCAVLLDISCGERGAR